MHVACFSLVDWSVSCFVLWSLGIECIDERVVGQKLSFPYGFSLIQPNWVSHPILNLLRTSSLKFQGLSRPLDHTESYLLQLWQWSAYLSFDYGVLNLDNALVATIIISTWETAHYIYLCNICHYHYLHMRNFAHYIFTWEIAHLYICVSSSSYLVKHTPYVYDNAIFVKHRIVGLLEIDGSEKLILLRSDHTGMSLEVLIECGVSSYCAYRYSFHIFMTKLSLIQLLYSLTFKLKMFICQGHDNSCLERLRTTKFNFRC